MLAYAVRKLLTGVVVLFLASIVIFGLTRLAGDPLTQLRQDPRVSEADVQRISAIYGLDRPVTTQYFIWIGGVLQGDFGQSFAQREPVNDIIGRRVWPTVLLMGTSLIFTVIVAIPLGVYSAVKKYSAVDKAGTFLSFLGYAMPSFFLGLMLQLLLGVYLTSLAGTRVFYTSGIYSPGGGGFVDLLQHLTLPVLTLSAISIASYSRFQRSAMLDVLSSDYLRTARAKGLSRRAVYLKHAFRNALIPIVTLIALDIAFIFGGAVVTETVFAWPGLGFQLIDSIFKNDYNVARALLLIAAALVVLFNLVADLVYAFVDPRVSFD